MNSPLLRSIVNALKGCLIGVANTIPGVSGGTIAVVTRLYDDLITAISSFFRTGWKKNTLFLLPVIAGIGVGIVLSSRIVGFFLENYPTQTNLFFIGLILGSLPFLVKIATREKFRPVYMIPFVISLGLLVAMAIVGRLPETEPITELTFVTAIFIFGTGIIGSATMIIPGVSGGFVLLLIGMYSTFIWAAKDMNLPILAVLLPGLIVGVVLVSRIMNFLLSRYHGITYWAILGLVLGSVVAIWPRTETGAWFVPGQAGAIATTAAALIVGFMLALSLGSDRKEQHRAKTATNPEGDAE